MPGSSSTDKLSSNVSRNKRTSRQGKTDTLTRQCNASRLSHKKNKRNKRHHHHHHHHQKSAATSENGSRTGTETKVKTIPKYSKISVNKRKEDPPPGLDIDVKTLAVLQRKNYKVLEKLKAGAFGQVYKGVIVSTNELVAIKVMEFQRLSSMFRLKYVPRELKALIECQHRYIVAIYDIIRSNNRLYIFMEFCSNGDMAMYVKKNGACTETLSKIWFSQMVEALLYVHHKLKMAHRDIKLDNILLDEKYIVKLTDFGFAKDSWNELKNRVEMAATICGTEPYMCPQLVQRLNYNPYLADVWAMGVVLYCLLEGRFPFTWTDPEQLIIEQMRYPKHIKTAFQQPVSEEVIDLVTRMVHPDEKKRMTLREVSEHPWLKCATVSRAK